MNCNECRYLLFDYVDNQLSSESKQTLDEHMASCPECARRLEELQEKQTGLEEPTGLFFYLLKPSGGYKRLFVAGALITFILFAMLTYLHFKHIVF